MPSSSFLLKVTDFKGPQHWRWELTDDKGKFLADQEVNLDPKDANYQAFVNLDRYLWTHSDPEHRIEDQTRIMNEVGDWVGKNVFGDVGVQLAKLKVPLAVRVQVSSNARGLLYLPLEMARIGGKPLAQSNARLVFELADREQLMDKAPVGEKLRILAVFSLPTDASALSLRRERYELIKFINEIAQNKGLAIDLKVLQYGVTQEDLGKILMEGKGWDIIHFSGHGERSILLLEKPDGTTDPVSSKALAELLAPAAKRLKLVTLSSCLSAAATIEETMRQLKLWKAGAARVAEGSEPSEEGGVPALAWELEKSLDCAVLAMRYSVGDEFAIGLASEFYRLLLDEGQPLAEALQMAMKSTLKGDYSASIPPISLATPTLCGGLAANLAIEPPRAAGEFQKPYASLAGFPDETEHFVGRAGPLGKACAALAPASKKRAVLFHGMAGAGKTACAVEVAYHYHRSQTRFQWFVWYSALKAGEEISGALRNFALAMENKLKGLEMVNVIGDAEKFESWLPTLSEYLSHNSVLIVLDNIENLLTSEDGWRDKRWGSLLKALLGHKGQSRLVITSRRVPMDIHEKVVCRIPIHALSLNESLLLARELPNLGKLLAGKSGIDPEEGRELVFRTLRLVQGHPKLIEFAEGQAADPEALERYLDEAAGSWGDDEGGLQKFFEKGESAKDAEEFMKVLMGWTRGVAGSLPDGPRMLFKVLCALEGEDRQGGIVKQVWPVIWEKLGLDGEAPEVEPTIDVLKAASLVEVRRIEGDVEYSVHPGPAEADLGDVPRLLFSILSSAEGGIRRSMLKQVWPLIWDQMNLEGPAPEVEPILDTLKSAGLVKAQDIEGQSIYSMHPGVAEAGLGESGEDLRSAVDFVMAGFWMSIFDQAKRDESKGLGQLVVRSCLSSAPYLMRQKRWAKASAMLEQAIYRDVSPGTVEMILPMLRHIAEATKGTDCEIKDLGGLARALLASGRWQEAEGMLRILISRCEAVEDFRSANVAARYLFQILRDTGRFEGALDLVEKEKSYALRAGLGTWNQIAAETQRLQILNQQGRYSEVLEEVDRLRDQMRSLPCIDEDNVVEPWNVVEVTLAVGRDAAQSLEKWDQALGLNVECREVKKARDATDLELASTDFNDYGPLLSLKRYDEAEDLLHRCRAVFEKENYIMGLSRTLAALADLESRWDHLPQALEFGQKALRYSYTLADPADISVDHYNLANYLRKAGSKSALAHRLASAIIDYQIGSGGLASTIGSLALNLNEFGTDALPGSFDEFCKEVEKVKGVRFRELFQSLPKRAKDGDEALEAVGCMLAEMLNSQSKNQPSDQSAAEE